MFPGGAKQHLDRRNLAEQPATEPERKKEQHEVLALRRDTNDEFAVPFRRRVPWACGFYKHRKSVGETDALERLRDDLPAPLTPNLSSRCIGCDAGFVKNGGIA